MLERGQSRSGDGAVHAVPKESDFFRNSLRTNVLGRNMGEVRRLWVPSQSGGIFIWQCYVTHDI